MGRVLTNNTSLQVAEEETIGVLPTSPTWYTLEPNSVGSYGATITTTPRSPISRSRQRRKGSITDLDSAVEFEADLTLDHWRRFVESFVFASATNRIISFAAADTSATGFTVPALVAAQVDLLAYAATGAKSLFHAAGYAIDSNNGLKVLDAAPVIAGTTLDVSPAPTVETAAANSILDIAGVRAVTGDLALSITGTTGTLTSQNNSVLPADSVDFTAIGLTVGQMIHIGGLDAGTRFTAANYGYARITAIASAELSLDRLDASLADSAGTGVAVDLLFGQFIRNVRSDNDDYLERSFTFEETWVGNATNGDDTFEYAKGNLCNTMALNLPLADKVTMSFAFIGTDSEPPTTTRATNADTPVAPLETGAFNTTSDCVRMRIAEVDESGIYTDFKSITFTFNNNVSPEKVLCNLGAKYMNFGNFEVDIETQVLFADPRIPEAIRQNRTVSFALGLKNDDGCVYLDIPSATLGGGGRELPVNESVLINLTIQAFEDPILKTSIGVSIFPVVP
ncbi:major capsid protein [Shewanella phage S0112]|nr:major capsid protein [Shewanella phage S0112]